MIKVAYDQKAKILAFRLSQKKSVDSDVQENVVIDRDKDGNIVNIDIMSFGINEFKKVKSPLGRIAHITSASG